MSFMIILTIGYKIWAVSTELDIDLSYFWPESWMDLTKFKLKRNKHINWSISQKRLIGIIILRLSNLF
jgi:ABC-type Fe3+ transport system substrate-binding protein